MSTVNGITIGKTYRLISDNIKVSKMKFKCIQHRAHESYFEYELSGKVRRGWFSRDGYILCVKKICDL